MTKAPIQSTVNILMVETADVNSWQSYRWRIASTIELISGEILNSSKNESFKMQFLNILMVKKTKECIFKGNFRWNEWN